jgi:hypothetical protein
MKPVVSHRMREPYWERARDLPVFLYHKCQPDGEQSPQDVDETDKPAADNEVAIPTPDVFIREQQNDPDLDPLIRYLENRECSRDIQWVKTWCSKLKLKDGLLVKTRKRGQKPWIVVPTSLVTTVIMNYHNRPTAGHTGHKRNSRMYGLTRVKMWKTTSRHVKYVNSANPPIRNLPDLWNPHISLSQRRFGSRLHWTVTREFQRQVHVFTCACWPFFQIHAFVSFPFEMLKHRRLLLL